MEKPHFGCVPPQTSQVALYIHVHPDSNDTKWGLGKLSVFFLSSLHQHVLFQHIISTGNTLSLLKDSFTEENRRLIESLTFMTVCDKHNYVTRFFCNAPERRTNTGCLSMSECHIYKQTYLSSPQIVEPQLQVQLSGMQSQSSRKQQDRQDRIIPSSVEEPSSTTHTYTSKRGCLVLYILQSVF